MNVENFNKNNIVIPKTKSYRYGSSFHKYYFENLVKGSMMFVLESDEKENSVALELLQQVIKNKKLSTAKITVLVSDAVKEKLEKEREGSRISFVKKNSDVYIKALATSEFIVCDSYLPSYYVCHEGQTYMYVGCESQHARAREEGVGFISEDNMMSNLLNATYLISLDSKFTQEVYLDAYRLNGIYQGTILEKKQECALEDFVSALLGILMGEKVQTAIERKASSTNKKKVLFVVSYDSNSELWKYTSILDNINTEEYDVTLLNVAKLDGETKKELESLSKRVRIINKVGRVNYSDKSFIQLETLRYAFRKDNELENVLEHRPRKEFELEWKRLLGSNELFDTAILVSPRSVFWYAMFMELKNTKIKMMRPDPSERDLNNPDEVRIYDKNNVRICDEFDEIITFDEGVVEELKASGLIEKAEIVLFDDEYCVLKSYSDYGTVMINGEKYWNYITAQKEKNVLAGVYVIAPKEGNKSVFVSMDEHSMNNVEIIMSSIYSYVESNKEIEIYLGMPYSSKKDAIDGFSIKEEYVDKVHVVYNYITTVEFLEKMDRIVVLRHFNEKRYQYIAAELNKPYSLIKLADSFLDESVIKSELERGHDMKASGDKAKYIEEQQAQINRILD